MRFTLPGGRSWRYPAYRVAGARRVDEVREAVLQTGGFGALLAHRIGGLCVAASQVPERGGGEAALAPRAALADFLHEGA